MACTGVEDQGKSVVRSQKRLGSKKGSRGDAESADEEPEGKVTRDKEKQISEGRAAEVRSRFLPSDISLFVFFVPPPRFPRANFRTGQEEDTSGFLATDSDCRVGDSQAFKKKGPPKWPSEVRSKLYLLASRQVQ